MTHRDGFPRFSARSAWRGAAGHRSPCVTPSESIGKPPFRSRRRPAGGRRKASTMSRRTRGFPPTRPMARRIAYAPWYELDAARDLNGLAGDGVTAPSRRSMGLRCVPIGGWAGWRSMRLRGAG